jgi:hypothetical protein
VAALWLLGFGVTVVDESATATRIAAPVVVEETVTLVALAVTTRTPVAAVVGLVVRAASALLAEVLCVAVAAGVGEVVTEALAD